MIGGGLANKMAIDSVCVFGTSTGDDVDSIRMVLRSGTNPRMAISSTPTAAHADSFSVHDNESHASDDHCDDVRASADVDAEADAHTGVDSVDSGTHTGYHIRVDVDADLALNIKDYTG